MRYPIKGRSSISRVNDIGLKQIIVDPTRVTVSYFTTFDLIFTNSLQRVTDSGTVELSLSDHFS